jgi:hypothetical protein
MCLPIKGGGHVEIDEPDESLTQNVAREVCQRTNGKALLGGSVASVGAQYLIALKVSNCQTGDSLASATAQAEGRDKVLQALGDAGNALRQKLGESLASVKKSDKPLEQATTSSLEALKAYTQGTAPEVEQQLLSPILSTPLRLTLASCGPMQPGNDIRRSQSGQPSHRVLQKSICLA